MGRRAVSVLARRRRLGLRSRLALLIAGMSLAVLVVVSWFLIQLSGNLAAQTQREQGVALLQSLAPSSARSIAVNDLASLDDQLAETVLQVRPSWTEILFIQAYDAAGRSLLRAEDGSELARQADRLVDAAFLDCALNGDDACWQYARSAGGNRLLFVSVPASSGLRWGTLVGGFDVHGIEGLSQRWSRKALAFAIGLAGLAFLCIWFVLSRLVMVPLARLTHAAQRMEQGDLSARAQLEPADELGELGHVFDSMATKLQAHTQDLERKVAERSAQIRQQNNELERVNQQLTGINAQLERLATTDALTGLHNRRYLQRSMDFELVRAQRAEHPFCLLMMDIDHFKKVNDTWGHAVGDQVLVEVARLLQENLRTTDLRARWGGEEFVALLLDSDREAGMHTAEKIRSVIERTAIEAGLDQPVRVTISIGVACFPDDGVEERKLFAHADDALYRAKEGGRNRVES
jgi:diguanylate cyclase (GGDEF)-like protein